MFKKIKLYPFIAGIFDFYLLSFLLGTVFALLGNLLQAALNPFVALSIVPIGLIIVLVYYRFLACRVNWFSPGEILVGRQSNGENKEWHNPFGYNRWALFLITFVTLAITSNIWDGLGSGRIYPLNEIIFSAISLFMLSFGVVNLGRGQIWSICLVVIYFVIYAGRLWNAPSDIIPQNGLQILATAFLVIAALHLIIALIYGFLKNRADVRQKQNEQIK